MSDDNNTKRSRASGEVLDYLLREFDVNQNPNPDQRKDISDRTGMTEKAVRIWFQNRRAKLRKFERLGKPVKQGIRPGISPRGIASGTSSRSNSLTNVSVSALDQHSETPNELNEKYCFIDCSSLSVGSWQRIKSGQHDHQALKSSLINLSPFTLDQFMNTVDLMVILSKKNHEINYFFAAISNNSKILFRIFYPISSVISSSLSENAISKENSELRLKLSHTPKFSVYFFSGINANLNQWSICDDFSEAQQVSSAFYAPGGTSTPHVLVGSKSSLEFLLEFVRIQNQTQPPDLGPAIAPHYDTEMKDGLLETSSVNVFDPVHVVEKKGSLDLERGLHDANQFDSKTDAVWHDSAQGDHGFAMKGISPLDEFENHPQSPVISQRSSLDMGKKYVGASNSRENENRSHILKKSGGDFTDLFPDSPDFFNAVETTGSQHISSQPPLRNNEDLINSPSTNIQSFNNLDVHGVPNNDFKDHHSNYQEGPSSLYSARQFNPALEQQSHEYHDEPSQSQAFTYEGPISGPEYQSHDLLASPSISQTNPTPGANVTQSAQEDQFIDYNGDA